MSAWEISTKFRLGVSPTRRVAADIAGALASQGFSPLEIAFPHAQRAGGLRGGHRDPFDRMPIAQAQMEDLPLVSNEEVFDAFGISRLW